MADSTRKDVARRLLSAAGQGDVAATEPLIAEDFVLEQMVRDPDAVTAPTGTSYDRASYLGFLGAIAGMTQNGMNLTFDLLVEDGDNVIVFGVSDALTPSGWRYRNAYCWRLVFRGTKVIRMHEYYDTALGQRLLAG